VDPEEWRERQLTWKPGKARRSVSPGDQRISDQAESELNSEENNRCHSLLLGSWRGARVSRAIMKIGSRYWPGFMPNWLKKRIRPPPPGGRKRLSGGRL
jgi:hypothetical protein